MAWDVLSGAANMAWDVLSGVTKIAWDVLSGVANLCGMFCPGWQKMAWDVLSRDVLSYIRHRIGMELATPGSAARPIYDCANETSAFNLYFRGFINFFDIQASRQSRWVI